MRKNTKTGLQAVVLGLAMVLAPMAQAVEKDAPSRDTGVGQLIARQGNEALALIRAEAKAAVCAWALRLPAPGRVVKASQPAGGNVAVTSSVRAAE